MTREEREDAIDIIQSILDKYEEDECQVTEITIGDEDIKALKMAIKALEQDESFAKKAEIVISQLRADRNKSLETIDKIRAEIERWHKEGTNWSDIRLMKIEDIIDKYKTESEE